ncbi:MAG TPA: MBL fold metallo-hydrolase [Flavilitoribacter sp.]|nr:MBL fold metallo-hydrolase [Flavilitoribacter sp.]HMQ88079.1 MBL fold metallo-hydrolase [Flavilitoribacter sp.]
MKVEQIYTGCLAEAAYYIESEGEAVIIDPLRETRPYLEKLKETGANLKYIFETHFHADFVSGHVDLAKKTGAAIVYGPNAEPDYEVRKARDGEEIRLGKVTFKVLHTPGHTMESTTYLLRDESGKDYAIFTGDTLFLGDVGRPDLAIKQGKITREDLAGFLFDSLRNKIMPLADDVIVYPAHGAGSACGKNLSSDTWGYLGDQKKTNYALRADMTRDEFIREVTAGLTPPPQYFAKNAMMNKSGYQSFDKVLEKGAIALNPEAFETVMEQEDALVLDVRPVEDFAAGHVPGSIFIGLDGSFAPWVGALIVDLQQPILIVAPEGRAEETVTRLARVGYDNTLGYLEGGINAWKAAGKEAASIESISASELENRYNLAGADLNILDVRKPSEFVSQHLLDAVNYPLDYINNNMGKLRRGDTYYLHCRSGYRSMVAASILKARGFDQVIDVANGWKDLENTSLPKSAYACPTTIDQEVLDQAVQSAL